MKRPYSFLLYLVFLLALFSCQKEPAFPGGGNITGLYDFAGVSGQTRTTITTSQFGIEQQAVVRGTFVSGNNTGSVEITADEFRINGVSFTVDTMARADLYVAGLLVNSTDVPLAFDLPSYTDTTGYQVIGSDSIFFSEGFISLPIGGGTVPAMPVGARYSWSGDTLLLRTPLSFDTTLDINGSTARVVNSGLQVVKLKKR